MSRLYKFTINGKNIYIGWFTNAKWYKKIQIIF